MKLTKKQTEEYIKWTDIKFCLEAVKQDGYALQYVKEQSEAVCLEAVKRSGDAYIYVSLKLAKAVFEGF